MDKVFSTRIEESIISQINRFVKDQSISKKGLVEAALKQYLEEHQASSTATDIIRESCGSWVRDEAGDDIRRKIRKAFNRGYARHHDLNEPGKTT